jgi:hypothetical protein
MNPTCIGIKIRTQAKYRQNLSNPNEAHLSEGKVTVSKKN